jgi:S-adenosylmethionine hydrolase
MAATQLITLLTDFGTTDAYVGIVKGILSDDDVAQFAPHAVAGVYC